MYVHVIVGLAVLILGSTGGAAQQQRGLRGKKRRGASRPLAPRLGEQDLRRGREGATARRALTPWEREKAAISGLRKLREEMLTDHPSAVLAWEAAYEADPENEDRDGLQNRCV